MLDPEQMLREIKQRYQAERDALPETWPCERHGAYSSGKHEQVRPQCPTCRIEADAAVRAWHAAWRDWHRWQAAGVPSRYQARTLANWKPRSPADHKVLVAVRQWFGQLDGGDLGALVHSGPPGLGKTHLAVGLIVEAIKAGMTAIYCPTRDLLPALRASYDRASEVKPESILQPLRSAELLVLDDVGTGRGSSWEQETIGDLIDARYRDGGALVLTTNATPGELALWIGERGADRIQEFGLVLTLAGQSYRARAATDAGLRNAEPAFLMPARSITTTTTIKGEPVAAEHHHRSAITASCGYQPLPGEF